MKVCRKFKLTYFWAKRRKSNNRSAFQILMWSECQIHFMFVIRHSISIPTVQVLNADDRFEIHKSDSDSSPTFWSGWSGKYKRYIMKKRETRERHENAYHGLRLREEENISCHSVAFKCSLFSKKEQFQSSLLKEWRIVRFLSKTANLHKGNFQSLWNIARRDDAQEHGNYPCWNANWQVSSFFKNWFF